MLFTVKDIEVAGATVGVSADKTTRRYAFTIKYTTQSTPHKDRHMGVDLIPMFNTSEEIQWVEQYVLVEGARSGYYGIIGQDNVSLKAYRVELVSKERWANGVHMGSFQLPVARGLLTEKIGDDQSDAANFAVSAVGDKFTRDLVAAFAQLGAKQFRALDSGLYLLFNTVEDEHFNPHNVTVNERTVAMFTQFDTALKFRLAESLLVPYGLSVDTTNGVTYLDEAGNTLVPNFFSWL
ncbi:hypothetical protein pEaSNUABM54_00143 [Erwinia phage pEa_SNUABM_54]|nr:hypothetical protein pEaSNUABM54_00143 [Erwinia phage pEa_SNUABM_54]